MLNFQRQPYKFSNHPVYVCTNGTFIFCRFKIIRTCPFDFSGDAFSETYHIFYVIDFSDYTLLESDPN